MLAITNIDLCLVVAVVLFVVAAVICLLPATRSFQVALLAAGLVFLTLAFLVDP